MINYILIFQFANKTEVRRLARYLENGLFQKTSNLLASCWSIVNVRVVSMSTLLVGSGQFFLAPLEIPLLF